MVSVVRDPRLPLGRMELRFASARRSLFSSTLLGSAAWGALLLALAFALSLWRVGDSIPIVSRPADGGLQFLPPPPSISPPGGRAPAATHKTGTITPVQKELALPDVPPTDWDPTAYEHDQADPVPCSDEAKVTRQPTPVAPVDEIAIYVDEIPFALVRVEPEYPELARSAGMEGIVRIEAVVGRDGAVRSVRVLDPGSLFDEAAKTAALAWRFRPATVNGHPVTAKVGLTFRFTLH